MNMMELLRNHSVFWSKLGFCYDPPRLGKDGKPIVFFDNWEQVKKYHRDFYNAGIRLLLIERAAFFTLAFSSPMR